MAHTQLRPGSRTRPAALLMLLILALVFTAPAQPGAASANLVISQVYGGGGNSGATYTNDFVELFNRGTAPVSLAGLSIQYASATGTGNFGSSATLITELPAVSLAPGQYYLVQEAQGSGGTTPLPTPDYVDLTPINMSGTGGKVALVAGITSLGCNGGSTPCDSTQVARIIDLVGWDGANFSETSPAPATTNTTAVLRNDGGCTETDNNAADFSVLAPGPRSTAATFHQCGVVLPTDPGGTGAADPASLLAGSTTLLTVTVEPGTNPTSTGLAVVADLAAIGGSPIQTFHDDGTNGDVTAGDLVFSFSATVAPATPAGPLSLPAAVSDAQGRTGFVTIPLVVEPPVIAVHDIQGPGDVSPYAGQPVATTGIVTGVKYNGFYIQAPDAEADGNPATSEGVFVFTSSAPPASAAVGNAVKVIGTVQEYVPSVDPFSPPTTEIGGSPSVTLLSSGNPLPAPVTITAAYTNPAGPIDQLEPREGMRVQVESLTVVAPTEGNISEANATATSNGVFYGVITGGARPFREPGLEEPTPPPAGAPTGIPRFDGNPERIRVDSNALTGSTPIDVATGAVVTGLVGPLDYAYRTYTILQDPGATPAVEGGVTMVPVPAPADNEFTVASFNLQRFFDTVNDPATSDAVLTTTAFGNRLNKASLAIREVLGTPDILGVQEAENLATLQALATKINQDAVAAGDPDPMYQAYLEEGNDVGGIDVGFLVKSARVGVTSVTQVGKHATYIDPNTGNPAPLNDRPPLVLDASVADLRGGPAFPVTVIVNHLRSLSGIADEAADGPRVRAKRAAQAEFLASLIQARQVANPGVHIVSVGDYNAYQFNDGYVDVIGTIAGTPTPADQVVVASPDLVDPNLTDLVNLVPQGDRYSYSFGGNAQELDHVLVSASMLPRVSQLAYGRSDADFPEVLRNDPNRPERISDHDASVAYFTMPSADISIAVSASPEPVLSGSTLTYTLAVSNSAPDPAFDVVASDTLPAEVTLLSFAAPAGWTCLPSGQDVSCSAPTLAAGATAVIELTTTVACDLPNGTTLTDVASVATSTYDEDPDNNTATFVSTVLNPPPVIDAPVATPAILWPANHKLVNVLVDYETTDNCGAPPVCTLGVTSNEPLNGPGDGNTAFDWLVVDAHRLQLRAERAGGGTGRIYTIAVTCVDGVGNRSTKTTTVSVPKSQR